MIRSRYTTADFDHSPFLVFYEVTRACDLVCAHCRACAQPRAHPSELDTTASMRLIEDLASFPAAPLLVLTGGDPLKRADLDQLIRHARKLGLTVAMSPSATPLVTVDALARLHDAGVSRIAMSLDGVDAHTHDSFRGVPGSYELTRTIMKQIRAQDISLQVNTTITTRNVDQVDAIAELLADEDVALWSVFFLVPVGRGLAEQRIAPERYEQVFEQLHAHARRQPYAIKTTEAPHYRRFVMRRGGDPLAGGTHTPMRAPLGVNDGRGVMFVSHVGQVFPSGFLPIDCGRFPQRSVVDIYQNAPVFRELRDVTQLKGKCGACRFNTVCGGSRARAYALTRDHLAPERDCTYIPDAWLPELKRCSA